MSTYQSTSTDETVYLVTDVRRKDGEETLSRVMVDPVFPDTIDSLARELYEFELRNTLFKSIKRSTGYAEYKQYLPSAGRWSEEACERLQRLVTSAVFTASDDGSLSFLDGRKLRVIRGRFNHMLRSKGATPVDAVTQFRSGKTYANGKPVDATERSSKAGTGTVANEPGSAAGTGTVATEPSKTYLDWTVIDKPLD